jgi:hypothetical protein
MPCPNSCLSRSHLMTDGAPDGASAREKKPRIGRPSNYTPELAETICSRMSNGESLREICRSPGMPPESTAREWVRRDVDGFADKYWAARRLLAEYWADEIIQIADDGSNDWVERQLRNGSIARVQDREHVQRSALRVDSRKWLLAKLNPKKYGDRSHTVLTGASGGPVQVLTSADPDTRLRFLLRVKAAERGGDALPAPSGDVLALKDGADG